jgi:hypothetical protein
MTDPISFTSASARHGLPFLFAGQAQKEFYVNEAHALVDMLLHPAVEGETNTPPANPAGGECWLVGATPTGAWAGSAGNLACYQGGTWQFSAPRNGMSVLVLSTGQTMRYLDGWQIAQSVAVPNGGTTVDQQAREAIAGLISAMSAAGILPSA